MLAGTKTWANINGMGAKPPFRLSYSLHGDRWVDAAFEAETHVCSACASSQYGGWLLRASLTSEHA